MEYVFLFAHNANDFGGTAYNIFDVFIPTSIVT